LESLKTLYLEGFDLDLSRVWEGVGHRRVPLPTYPFERKRYWLDGTESDEPTTSQERLHPLLGTRVASGATETRFEALYGIERVPFLRDHRVHGQSVLPTAAGLEAARAAGQAHFGGAAVQVEDLTYHQTLILPDTGARRVHLVVQPSGDQKVAFRIVSSDAAGESEWQTHMSGVLSRVVDPPFGVAPALPRFDAHSTRERCARKISPDDYYAMVREL